jgi:UPF0716 family protein affecting phage T7 exclusion
MSTRLRVLQVLVGIVLGTVMYLSLIKLVTSILGAVLFRYQEY